MIVAESSTTRQSSRFSVYIAEFVVRFVVFSITDFLFVLVLLVELILTTGGFVFVPNRPLAVLLRTDDSSPDFSC